MHKRTILIVGEIFVDTHLDIIDANGPLVRLGGIFHSARACSSIECEYALAYYAPDYLDEDINYYSCKLKTKGCYRLGIVEKSPNVMLINESKEIGNQGYYNVLKDQAQYIEIGDICNIIDKVKPTDILIYPGRYDTKKLLGEIHEFDGRIHIDINYDCETLLNNLDMRITSIILSTSSSIFKERFNASAKEIINYFDTSKVDYLLIKENRGGSYCYSYIESKDYESPAYFVPTMHSVGVGDVYNSIFVSDIIQGNLEKMMKISSMFAAQYSGTMYYEKFQSNVQLILKDFEEFIALEGIRLSWDERKKINIYLAAPDFPNVNTLILEKLTECLRYHNFNPRLPIKENGLVMPTTSEEDKFCIYGKDMELIENCDLLIATLIYNDPGTLVELGMFKQSGKPTIIFDPYNVCNNMFVRHTPDFYCRNIGEVLDSTFRCLRRR